jgi:hypothetical protein
VQFRHLDLDPDPAPQINALPDSKNPGLKDGGLHPASWWGDSFLFLRQLQSNDGGGSNDGVQLEIVVLDPTQRVITCTAQQLESDASCLHTGLKLSFPGPTKDFDDFIKPYVDYYGMVVYDHPHLFFAAIV